MTRTGFLFLEWQIKEKLSLRFHRVTEAGGTASPGDDVRTLALYWINEVSLNQTVPGYFLHKLYLAIGLRPAARLRRQERLSKSHTVFLKMHNSLHPQYNKHPLTSIPYTIVLALQFVAAGLNKQCMEHFVSNATKYNVSFMSCKTQ